MVPGTTRLVVFSAMERSLSGVSIWKSHKILPALSELAVALMFWSQDIKRSKDEEAWDSTLEKTEFCGKEMIVREWEMGSQSSRAAPRT